MLWLPETADGSVAASGVEVIKRALSSAAAILIGPGLEDVDETAGLITGLVAAAGEDLPVVLDAYALGQLAQGTLAALRGRLALTPNRGELERLLSATGERPESLPADSADPQLRLAERYAAVLSSDNEITTPAGDRWTAPAGHSGLGTSGSGDVLAGALQA